MASSSNDNNTRRVCYIFEEADENEELSTIRKIGKPALEKMTSDIGNSLLFQRWTRSYGAIHLAKLNCSTHRKKALRKQKSDELAEKEDS